MTTVSHGGAARVGRNWSALSAAAVADAVRRDPVAILPLAATEQHGPHLPLSTDVDIGMGILTAALDLLPPAFEAWTLPMITVGASQEHTRFAGTESVSTEELVRVIVAHGARLAGAGVRRMVLSNSHGGNRHAIDAAALFLRAEHDMLVAKASWFRFPRPPDVTLPEGEWRHGLHGGALETAMMLHLRPERVRRDAIERFPSLGEELERTLRRVGPEGPVPFAWLAGDLNPLGVVGDAELATAEMGRTLVDHYARVLADVIQDARDFPLDRLRLSRPASTSQEAGAAPIDERTAWALVLSLVPGSVRPGSTVRVTCGEHSSAAWLDVTSGGSWTASSPLTDEARDLFDLYVPLRVGADLLIGQLGQSLDGRIATDSGASHFVTGAKDIERLHRIRALVDAVIVGAETVVQDDPRLTVRLVEGANPVRVVLDPSGRLDSGHRVFSDIGPRTLVVRRDDGAARRDIAAEVDELRIRWTEAGGFDLEGLLGALRARGLRRILVEGGGVTVSRFLQAGLLDRLHLTVAPLLIGSGRPSITLESIPTLDQAIRPRCRRFTLGEDVLFDLDMRERRA
jgi:creatinine amidohydrolase